MNKRGKNQKNSTNLLLSVLNTWQKFNEEIPEKIESRKTKEKIRNERERKLGSKSSNKKSYFTEKEVAIVEELVSNPRKSYVEIAKILGLSRHTVKKKIEEMINNSKIKIYLGINHKRLTLDLIIFNLVLKNLKYLDEIFQDLQSCPRVFSITKDISKNSITFLLGIEKSIDEGNNQMVCMMERFQLDERVKESNVVHLYPEIFPKFLLFKPFNNSKNHFQSNCNSNCEACEFFLNKRCPSCPASKIYSKKFFKMP